MSTPSTATATHPAYHYRDYTRPYPVYPSNTLPTTSAPENSRYGATSYPYAPAPTTTTLPFAQSARQQPAGSTPTMPAPPDGATPADAAADAADSNRRKKPDWGEFYKNGIPKEIIVIDDTPPPDHSKTASRGLPNPPVNGAAANPAGKRRRTGFETAYDLGYYDRPAYSANHVPHVDNSSGASSTDRTTSMQTTAPTSLGSQASGNGVYYEDANVGQKRKRVNTRKSVREEQHRRELEIAGDAFLSYVPPPKPPIKAKDVPVPVVRDVCQPSLSVRC